MACAEVVGLVIVVADLHALEINGRRARGVIIGTVTITQVRYESPSEDHHREDDQRRRQVPSDLTADHASDRCQQK
jgi:hypothetical protein